MSYIEKEKLIKADIASIENRVRHAFNQGYDLGFKDGKKRAKPQEQELTIKNNLGVDAVSRADARKAIIDHQYCDSFCEEHNIDHSINTGMALIALSNLPSLTPQLSSELEKNSKKLEKNFGELDCISRQAVLDLIADYDLSMGQVVRGIHALPSLTPQEPKIVSIAEFKYDKDKLKELINKAVLTVTPQEPKTGHWVHGEYCSECGCDVPAYIVDWKWQKDVDAKYCPNCGCRMVESQESEGT